MILQDWDSHRARQRRFQCLHVMYAQHSLCCIERKQTKSRMRPLEGRAQMPHAALRVMRHEQFGIGKVLISTSKPVPPDDTAMESPRVLGISDEDVYDIPDLASLVLKVWFVVVKSEHQPSARIEIFNEAALQTSGHKAISPRFQATPMPRLSNRPKSAV